MADRFELLERAGQGGMGEVWRARDLRTGEIVAVKRILRRGGETARFLREARLLERVKQPALVGHIAWALAERGLELPQAPAHERRLHAWVAAASVFRKGAPRVGLDHALHLARTGALQALGRTDDARASMEAAIARLGKTSRGRTT